MDIQGVNNTLNDMKMDSESQVNDLYGLTQTINLTMNQMNSELSMSFIASVAQLNNSKASVSTMTTLNQTISSALVETSQIRSSIVAMNSSLNSDISDVYTTINNMSSSMIAGWPDAISCTLTTIHGQGLILFYFAGHLSIFNDLNYYRTGEGKILFSRSNGTFNAFENLATNDCYGKSIFQLISEGKTFNFVVSV